MNAQRRKTIAGIKASIETLKAELEAVRDEEQTAFDNLPDSIQGGEQGQRMDEAVSIIETAIDSLGEATTELETIQ